jgi:hypothetical protein
MQKRNRFLEKETDSLLCFGSALQAKRLLFMVLVGIGFMANSIHFAPARARGEALVAVANGGEALATNMKVGTQSTKILRDAIGKVQAQVNWSFQNSDFDFQNATKSQRDWGISRSYLLPEVGAAKWKFAPRMWWKQKKINPEYPDAEPFDLSDEASHVCMSNRNVMVAGTSYQREVYYNLATLLKKNYYLDESFMMIPSKPLRLSYDKKDCSNTTHNRIANSGLYPCLCLFLLPFTI